MQSNAGAPAGAVGPLWEERRRQHIATGRGGDVGISAVAFDQLEDLLCRLLSQRYPDEFDIEQERPSGILGNTRLAYLPKAHAVDQPWIEAVLSQLHGNKFSLEHGDETRSAVALIAEHIVESPRLAVLINDGLAADTALAVGSSMSEQDMLPSQTAMRVPDVVPSAADMARADEDDDGADSHDEQQTIEERRRLREGYRELRHVNELFLQVKNTQDASLDSRALLQLAEISAHKIQRMKLDGGSFDIDDFINRLGGKLTGRAQAADADEGADAEQDDGAQRDADGQTIRQRFRQEEVHWEHLAANVVRLSSRAPLYGAIAVEAKQREIHRPYQRLVRDKTRQIQPQQLEEKDIAQQENETSNKVQMMHSHLLEVEPVSLFRFFVNPESFGQSVENLFYVSFLVHDGRVSLETSKDGDDIVIATEAQIQDGVDKIQQIMHFDMDLWRSVIEAYEITEPIIPTRVVSAESSTSRWY
nr:nuclear protein [Polyrhizophydium stewartii]